jgi:hypothetical protein
MFPLSDGEIVAVITPLAKSSPPIEKIQVSNNPLNFCRGRLFNNTGLKEIVIDAHQNEWYYGTTGVVKPLLPELEDL